MHVSLYDIPGSRWRFISSKRTYIYEIDSCILTDEQDGDTTDR